MTARFLVALFLVTLTGYISLSYEICWVRLYSFVSGSRAWAFGGVLGAYLIGLACGSKWSLRFQDAEHGANPKHLRAISLFVLGANVLGFLLIPLVSWLVTWTHFLVTLPLVGFAAAMLGATLPLICHFSIPPDEKAGARLSYLYLGNIIGSGAGSLITGFVLMDRLTIEQISVLLAILGLVLSTGVALYARMPVPKLLPRAGMTVALGVIIVLTAPKLFDGLYERLQLKGEYEPGERFDTVVESRFGVITVDEENKIYGGGVYDGYLGVGLRPDTWLVRPYFLSAVHPAPKEVLVIGLSGGAWAKILAHNPHVEKVTAVEINAAYSERVIPKYDAVSSLLTDPKVEIVIDDGRRWLRNNPERKFDAVVANSTYHWREHATALLSREFMQQVDDHLKPGGIYIFNATGSNRAAKTALEVFEGCALLLNNIVASNRPLEFDKERWRETLAAYEYDGEPLFDTATEKGREDLEKIVSIVDTAGRKDLDTVRRLWPREVLEKDPDVQEARPITDDNLGHEFWFW